MMPRRIRLALLSAALAAATAVGVCPSASGQVAQAKKTEAASGQQPQTGSSSLRVMLVVSDSVRAYKVQMFLNHVDFGRRLGTQAEKVFGESFAVVKTATALPADPSGYEGVDVAVVLDVPQGEVHTGFFNNPMTLTAVFVVRNTKGEELFRAREVANDNAQNLYHGADRLGEAVSRQFVQEMLANANVKNILSPPPPVEVKPALEDTSMMDSAGLDVPPPPPWAPPAAPTPGPAANTTGKP